MTHPICTLSTGAQVLALQSEVSAAETAASEQISRFRTQLHKAEALLAEAQAAWRSEVAEQSAAHEAAIGAAKREYVDAVEGFEW